MPVQIGAKLDSGFDDPLGMLCDCHRRIERFLGVLCQVATREPSRALSAEDAEAVTAALHYFREGGRRHNADEEESLFPRLRQAAPRGALDSIDRLEQEHHVAGELHDAVDRTFARWISAGALGSADAHALVDATRRLRVLYGDHIRAEEADVFPQAAQLLDGAAIAAIGSEFRARRQK
jgi:hemerythrin-like domain-containing protein